MKATKRELEYVKNNYNEVMHTTLNPNGPGVVRLHLVPPKIENNDIAPSVVVINGQDIVPVNRSWTILLIEFIKEINRYAGHEMSDEDIENAMKNICKNMKKIYHRTSEKKLRNDIYFIMDTFTKIAYRQPIEKDVIGYMSIGEYAPYMKAPHRMDLMVSAMTRCGKWHCNQKCLHCYAAGQPQAEEKELSTDDWKKIIDKCRAVGIPQLTFTGGEPTMREDLFELIEYSRWFVSRLNTNGVKLSKEYCEKLKKAEIDSVQITFYSSDEKIHNQLVGANNYQKTVEGIKNALASGLNISINTPLCSLNKDYVKTLEFLHDLGVEYVTCSGLIVTGNAKNESSVNTQLSKIEITNIFSNAVDFVNKNGMEINFTSPGWISDGVLEDLGINIPSCGACLSNMAITPSGNIVPCQSWLSDNVLGNMLYDNWEDVWNGEMTKKRREYSSKVYGICPLKEGEN